MYDSFIYEVQVEELTGYDLYEAYLDYKLEED